jgi:thiamine biosynthesis lipoprotein
MKTITFKAMGSQIFIAMDTEDPIIAERALDARGWFENWEQSLSRFRLTSELCEVNRHPGFPVKVSEPFLEVVQLALAMENKTDGLITPFILNALEAAGYTGSFVDLIPQLGSVLRQPFNPASEGQSVLVDSTNQSVTISAGTQLDFGGVAKGWAAHQTMLRLRDLASVLVDAGGDIAISGTQLDGTAWPVGVFNPFDEDNNLGLLMLSGCGVATSGRNFRRWFANGDWQHHIIDPRINSPAETDVVTATVVANDVMQAEAAAKMGIILGSESAQGWLDQQLDTHYMLVLENGSTVKSPGFINLQWTELWTQSSLNK